VRKVYRVACLALILAILSLILVIALGIAGYIKLYCGAKSPEAHAPMPNPQPTNDQPFCWGPIAPDNYHLRTGSEQGWLTFPCPTKKDKHRKNASNAELNIYRWLDYRTLPRKSYVSVCAGQKVPDSWIPIRLSYHDPTGCDYQKYGRVPGFGNESQYYLP
jgi:hypothetical protein